MSKTILFTVTYSTYCTYRTVVNERSKIQFGIIENTIEINSLILDQTQE